MAFWTMVILGACVGVYVAYRVLLLLTGRRSAAGIVTSRFGRSLRVVGGMLTMARRHVWRKIRRWITPRAKLEELERKHDEETAKRALETMGNMKGVLMKLGQIVSFMDESLPEAVRPHLRKLQNQAPPMDYETVARVIEDELGEPPEKIFADFDTEPVAAASIGQVHKALLRDGTAVAVKVQYPGVDKAIKADLNNLGTLMAMIGAVTPTLDAKSLAEELRDRMVEELDYERELKNQELFIGLYGDHADKIVPRVFPETSSKRVLTSEFIEGLGFYEFVEQADEAAKKRAVMAIHEFAFDSIWFHRVFNGDPHPGNYLFLEDGRVAFLDFGCVKHFDEGFLTTFRDLNLAFLEGDKDRYYKLACEIEFIRPGKEGRVTLDWLWDFSEWFYQPIIEDRDFPMTAEYCKQSLSVMFGDNMRKVNMPSEYVMLNRITFGLNSILAKLDACENWHRISRKYYYPDQQDDSAA